MERGRFYGAESLQVEHRFPWNNTTAWTSGGGERARAHDILIKAGAERLKNLLSSATQLWRESEQTLPQSQELPVYH